MNYETLLTECDSLGLVVKEKPLQCSDGLIRQNKIAIRKDIETQAEKACVLAEELGHYYTTTGDIIDQSDSANRKQELRARAIAYNKQIGLAGIIKSFKANCHDQYEMADFLGVPEKFLVEALEYYRGKYGISTEFDNYVIYFEPLGELELYK